MTRACMQKAIAYKVRKTFNRKFRELLESEENETQLY